MSESFFNAEQVAEMLGLHIKTVQRYMREGVLPASRIGKRWRVSGHDLSAFTEAHRAESAEPPERWVKVSTVVDIRTGNRAEAIRIANTLTAALNAKPPEYGQSTMTVQFIEPDQTVRVMLWGALGFIRVMLESIEMLTGEEREESK